MPTLELTDEQALRLWEQLPEEQKKRIIERARTGEPKPNRPTPQFGSGKGGILYMAPDFDAPLDDFAEQPKATE